MRASIAGLLRHTRSAAWVVADQAANPVIQIILTAFLVKTLSREDFGLWVLGITLVGMSQIISFGAGMAATKHVSADLGTAAHADAVAALRAALALALAGGVAGMVLMAAFAVPIAGSLLSNMGSTRAVAEVLLWASLAAAVQEIDGVYSGAMRGAERFDLSARVEVPARLCMGIVFVVVALEFRTLRPLFIALVVMLALKTGLKGWQVTRLFGDRRSWLPSFATAPLRRVTAFGLWQWLQATGSALCTYMDQLLVGSTLGAAALARYSICLQLAQYVNLIPAVMMQIVFPRVSALGERLDARARNALLRSTTLVAFGMACALGLVLALLARPLLAIWISPEFARDNQWLLIVLAAIHALLAFPIGAYYILLGTGQIAQSAKITLSAALAQVVVAVLLAPFGLLAFACNRLVYALGSLFLYRIARVREPPP